jgi:uncharacterized protein (DUF1778 family)
MSVSRDSGSTPFKSLTTASDALRDVCNDAIITGHCNDGVVTLYEVRTSEFLMSTSHTSKSVDASVPLNMRIKPATRNLIDRAAKLLGKTRTDFMLEASERRAEEVLLDRTIFTVSPEVYAEYLARLDAPAQSNVRLKRTMSTKAPWDNA